MKDDEEIWLGFIKRDIPKWEEYGIPEKAESWHQVYCDLRARVQKEVDKDTEKLKQAMEGINSERAKHSAKFVADQRALRLPQQRPSQKQRYASYDRKVGGITPVFTAPSPASLAADPLGAPAWSFERPQIPRFGSEKKKSSIFSATKRNKVLAVPTQKLGGKASQVKSAPRSLIEEHRQQPVAPAAPRKINPTLRVPGRSKLQSEFGSGNPATTNTQSLQEKETRLRALTTGKPSGSQISESTEAPSTSSKTPTLASSTTPSTSRDPSTSSPTKKVESTHKDLKRASNEPENVEEPKRPILTPEPDNTDNQQRKALKRGLPESSPQDSTEEPKHKDLKRDSPGPNSGEVESSKTPAPQAPRIATIRKRPASVFLPPKRKRLA